MRLFIRISLLVLSLLLAACNVAIETKGALQNSKSIGRLSITGPSSFGIKECAGPFTIALEDLSGSQLIASSDLTVDLNALVNDSPAPFFEIYRDGACNISLPSIRVSANNADLTFYLKSTVPQNVVLKVAAEKFDNDSHSVSFIRRITQLSVVGPSAIVLGDCSSTVTVRTLDVDGIESAVDSLTQIALTGAGGATFYQNAQCTTPIGSLTMYAGNARPTFYVKVATASVLASVTASSPGLLSASLSMNVVREVRQVAITGSNTASVGVCTPYSVQVKDAVGTDFNVISPHGISLSSSAPQNIFSDVGCSIVAAGVLIPTNSNSANFYLKATQETTYSLQAMSIPTQVTSTMKSVSGQSVPTQLDLSSSSSNLGVGVCVPISLTIRNGLGATVTTPLALTVNLGGTFFSNASCTASISSVAIPANGSSAAVYYRSNTLGIAGLTASANGLLPDALNLNVIQTLESAVLTGPASNTSGVCSAAYTLELRDGVNNVFGATSSAPFSFNGLGNGAVYLNQDCEGPPATVVTIPAGASQISVYYLNSTAQSGLAFRAVGPKTSNTITMSTSNNPLAPDPKFGSGGVALYSDSNATQVIRALAIQPDGRIIGVGSVDGNGRSYLLITRYLAKGIPDTSFGQLSTGRLVLSLGDRAEGRAVYVHTDGSIFVASEVITSGNADMVISRYDSNGNSVNTFGAGGKVHVDFSGGTETAAAMRFYQNSLFVVGSTFDGTTKSLAVARVNLSGVVQFAQNYPEGLEATSIAVTGANLSVGGQASATEDFLVLQINENGQKVLQFGNSGALVVDLGGNERVTGLGAVSGGNLVAVGTRSLPNGDQSICVGKYSATGAFQAGNSCLALTGNHEANGLAITSTGYLFIAGSSERKNFIVRLNSSNMALDAVVNPSQHVRDLGQGSALHAIVLQTDDKVVVGGAAGSSMQIGRHLRSR